MEDFENLVELADASASHFAQRPLFGEQRDGRWQWITYAEWQRGVEALRGGLATLGTAPGDRVAIVSRNSAAWATAAYASYGLGAAFVPMYESQRPADWEFILRDCGAKVAFARTPELAARLREMQPRLPELRHVIAIEGEPDGEPTLVSLQAIGRDHPAAVHAIAPGDLAGLIYTSGTTGQPKGVMLSHRNLTSNLLAAIATFPVGPDDRTVSFLPWAHVYGQLVELHLLISAGMSTAFNTDPDHLLDDLRSVQPTVLIAVPRVFNKLHAAVREQIEARGRLVRGLFWRGLAASLRRRRGEHLDSGERLALWLAGFLFASVRRKLGGHLRYAVSGSANLSREVAEFVDALGIEVYEGYGLTETSPIVAFNRPGHRKFGSTGVAIEGVRIELDESRGSSPGEGEIVVHGPNVMLGYHARPDENARVFTPDGGLRTGDLGRVDDDGYLFITGRIKEQYKLENGKYVMPTPLEERLALSPYIQTVMLHGASKPYNVALVVIDGARVREWAAEHGVRLDPDLARDQRVRELILEELGRAARDFRAYERPVDVVLSETPFTVENGLLTPTLKIKRREVLARFGTALEELYEHPHDHPHPHAPAA